MSQTIRIRVQGRYPDTKALPEEMKTALVNAITNHAKAYGISSLTVTVEAEQEPAS